MACNYFYKGFQFTESELDDFLLGNGKEVLDKYGDTVFRELSKLQIQNYATLSKIKEKGDKELLDQIKNKTEFGYEVGGKYKSITHVLSGVKSISSNKYLFPEFIIENYFKSRRNEWKQGIFSDKEIDILFDGQTPPKNTSKEMRDSYEQEILKMWEEQANIGTELHKGLQFYFSDDAQGHHNRNLTNELLFRKLRNLLDKDYINNDQIDQLIRYCRGLQEHLEIAYGGKIGKKSVRDTNLIYFTEMPVFGELLSPETNQPIDVLGKIDLVVLDSKGNIHTIDYKTSPADYKNDNDNIAQYDALSYSKAKKLAFTYQLNIYDRLLQSQGVNCGSHDISVAPIQLFNFRKENDKWVFDDIIPFDTYLDNLTQKQNTQSSVFQNLNLMFPDRVTRNVNSETLLSTVNKTMEYLFTIKSRKTSNNPGDIRPFTNTRLQTKDDIKKLCKENNMQQDAKGNYTVVIGGKPYTAKTEAELYKKVLNKENTRINSVIDNVNQFKAAIEATNSENFTKTTFTMEEGAQVDFMPKIMQKYTSGYYSLYKDLPKELTKKLDMLGIILLKNNLTNSFEVIKISKNNLRAQLNNGKSRENLLAKFEEDINEDSKSDSYMLKAKFGNIDLMETMIALNLIPEEFENGSIISRIHVINPIYQQGMEASSKELLYSFRKLTQRIEDKELFQENNFDNGRIKLASYAQRVYDELKILIDASSNGSNVRKFNSCTNDIKTYFDQPDNPEILLTNLERLRLQMETEYPKLKVRQVDKPGDSIESVYQTLMVAIAECRGIDFKQQNIDPDDYRQHNRLWEGHTGLRTDNPGVMANHNLNVLSEVHNRALQNTRDRFSNIKVKIRELEEKLKKSKSFTYLKERFYGNKVNMYKNMTYYDEKGDWLFKRPEELSDPTEREFLTFALELINNDRYKGNKNLEKWKREGDVRYYRVPLLPGGSVMQVSGMWTAIKDSLRSLRPKVLLERAKEVISNSMDEDSEREQHIKNNAMWEMTTKFDGGEDEDTRLRLLNELKADGTLKRPRGYYENNLAKLLMAHAVAYIQKEELNKVLPVYKAGQLFQVLSEISQNKEYRNSLKYLQDYVKVNIFNKPLVSDKDLLITSYAKKVMSFASALALGFAPRQLYQNVEGIWKGIGLILRNPTGQTLEGVNQFNKKDFMDSFFNTYRELIHFGNGRSKLELINEQFGLNDMDVNAYADRVYDDHSIIYSLKTYLYRMASRPDFYNRLTIFQTQMRADGTWDAYSVKDGKLVYDWTKDSRFDVLSKGLKHHPEYNKQFALFRETALQLEREGAVDQDGNLYKWKNEDGSFNPLPTAYTRQQSESYKALADMLYGYYSHEKRSLMQSTLIGSLVMQMYTYWSGKKNQYFAASAIKNQGKYVHVQEKVGDEWKPLYYHLKPNGEIDFDKKPTTDPKGAEKNAPFIQWRGQYHEGVVVTTQALLRRLANGVYHNENLKNIWDQYYNNPDENLKTIYRSNLIQLTYDTLLVILVGGVVGAVLETAANQYLKDNKDNKTAEQALRNTIAVLSTNIFKASVLDLNAPDSIFGRGMDWTPFSLNMLENQIKNWGTYLKGAVFDNENKNRKSFRDALFRSISAIQQTNAKGKGIWSYTFPKETEN